MKRLDKTLELATLSSVALSLLFAIVPSTHAATNVYDGKNFAVDYGVSSGDIGSFFSLSHANVTGSETGVEIPNLSSWKVDTADNTLTLTWNKEVDTADNTLTLTWNKADEFMNSGSPAFIGFKIFDSSNQLPDIVGASVTNTAYTPQPMAI